MVRDVFKPIYSSFLSCEKDTETILRKLFIENPFHAEDLKRLLVINAKDCLDNKESKVYKDIIEKSTLSKLMKDEYIRITPRLNFDEHEEVKSYIVLSFDNFVPNSTNPEFRDCTIHFDIICNTNEWELGDYRLRPIKIAGYIDGLLNKTRLSGIGQLFFMGCNELILNEEWSGYTLTYAAIHDDTGDDIIPGEE